MKATLALLVGALLLGTLILWAPWKRTQTLPVSPSPEFAALEARLQALEHRLEAPRLESGLLHSSDAQDSAREPAELPREESKASESVVLERLSALEAKIETFLANQDEQRTASDPQRLRALNAAIEAGDLDSVLRLLQEGLDPNARDDDRRTPLAVAAVAGDADLLALLLEHGAELERSSGRRRMTPLLAALDADQEDSALLLLERGANPTAVDKNGESALNWASFNGAPKIVDDLIAAGVDLDQASHWGGTPLMSAARKGRLEIVRALLEAGADVDLRDESGESALDKAVAAGHEDIVALLRAYGAR